MGRKRTNYYFTQTTENAIVRYNKSDDQRLRNIIYNEHINYAFDKLAENIKDAVSGNDRNKDLFDELFGDKKW